MKFDAAPLEEWMREFYFNTDVDIGSSGVLDLSMADLRVLLDITTSELDRVVLRDSTSWGGAALRSAVARRWGTRDPEQVMVTHGASEAIYLVLNTILEPGDEVVALEPVYHSLISTALTLGCSVRRWRLSVDDGFAVDVADAAALISPRTKLIVVNFPHNPTGVTVTAGQQRDLLDLAAAADAWVLWDNVFSELVYDSLPLPCQLHHYRKAISVGSLSKGYGLPGLRFGWCLADPDLLAGTLPLRDRMTLHLSPLVEFLACRVAERADLVLGPQVARAAANRAELLRWAEKNADIVRMTVPRGGVTALPRFPKLDDTEGLCRRLAGRDRVLLVPGNCFGHPDGVRLGFGGSAEELATGLDRLTTALRGHD